MKRIIYALAMLFIVTFSASPVMANSKPAKRSELTAEQRVQLQRIIDRVEEIRALDKSKLSKVEKKALKKELKELKERGREISQGVFLSFGAIIIIILLLILIL